MMNKIEFPRKDINGKDWSRKKIEKWYSNEVLRTISSNLNNTKSTTYNQYETALLNTMKDEGLLEAILLAPPIWLEFWAKRIDKNNLSKLFINDIKAAFDYDSFRKKTLVELAKKLNIKCCPYCNMHYTLYAEETVGNNKKEELAKFQFDHFYDKSEFPMLSMSLYNLIPSCAVCNHSKLKEKLSLSFHPYHSSICEQFNFKLRNPTALFCGEMKKKDLINVDLISKTDNSLDLNAFVQTFHLKALYQRHGDVAQEVFDKAYERPYYSNPNNFKWLTDRSSSYIKRLWMGTYSEENEIEKRPMTKFIQDLWEQAGSYKLP